MTTSQKHAKACKDYKAYFLDQHGYGFCEACGRSDKPLQTHHVMYASRFPKHEHLHDFTNLLLVCDNCHRNFHAGKLKDLHNQLVQERGLDILFGI